MKEISRWQCWIKGVWRSLRTLINTGYAMSGHDFVEEATYKNCSVTICKCEVCGKVDISWKKD